MEEGERDVPLVLGRYALLQLIARGGMGSVYLARTEGAAGFRKPVVLKLIHPHLMDDGAAVRSFVREAKLAARLVHPNIVQVVDFGEHEGQYLTVLEYVHGHDLGVLSRYLAETGRPLPVDHAAYVVHEVLRGLEFAHELRDEGGQPLGLVHHDISPHNVLLSLDGQVKLTDFGVARVKSEATKSGSNDLKGKLAYMAPEQVSGGHVDTRTDLFAVGIVLYEVLAGQRLFASEHEAATIMRVSAADVPDVRRIRSDLPEAVSGVISKALARLPEDRYQSATDFAADVRVLLGGKSPDEVEPSFRALIGQTFGEPGFMAASGPTIDLSNALQGEAISLSGKRRKRGADSAGTSRPRTKRRASLLSMLLLGVLAAVLAGGIATAVLVGLRPQGNRGGGGGRVAVIIDRQHRDSGLEEAGVESPTAPEGDGAATTLADGSTDGSVDGDSPATVRPHLRPLTGQRVTRTLMRRRGALRRCFRQHGEGAGGAATVIVRVQIAGSGSVQSASVEPASVGATALGRCLAAVASGTRFPRHPEDSVAYRVPMRVERD